LLEVKEDAQKVERAFLVGIQEEGMSREEAEDHLEELASLADTMGVPMVGRMLARLPSPSAHFYLGRGKAEEIKMAAQAEEADVLILDADLSPSQQRNWEEFSGIAVIDREEVILDIFAGRAQTREARLQVGLARMQYSLPRLKRAWTHLERQRGGAGLRGGPGELQLEVDRRRVLERIARLRRELKEVRKQRQTQRKSRRGRPVPTAAIVGYTNAGKSSLLRKLTGAEVLIEDKLFATLDTTTRRLTLPNNQPLLLIDTVGFIRKLPHHLVEAFKATLEEATLADFLVHVLDVSHPRLEEHFTVTEAVLKELGAEGKKTLIVLNKTDLPHDAFILGRFRSKHPLIFPVSTHTGEGLDALTDAFAEHFILPMKRYRLLIPQDRYDLLNLIHNEGDVLGEHYEAEGIWLEANLPIRFHHRVESFITSQIHKSGYS